MTFEEPTMRPTATEDWEHPDPTRSDRHYRYLFTAKHHGGGGREAARWAADVTPLEEFSVFDDADFHEIVSEAGYMYGVLRQDLESLRIIGFWGEEVAEFTARNTSPLWHGYPVYVVNERGSEKRRGEVNKPPKDVLARLTMRGLITTRERKRLARGKHT
jgi:hypothetical protein